MLTIALILTLRALLRQENSKKALKEKITGLLAGKIRVGLPF